MVGPSPNQFQELNMNDNPVFEDLLTFITLLCDKDIVDGNFIGEVAKRSVQKNENTARLLRYNNHIRYMRNYIAVFQSFHCPKCDTFFNRFFNLE